MNGQPQYIGSIRDQTERQRMHAMLARTDKLASIGLLSAGVAHEINNPLAYVLNNLVVLAARGQGTCSTWSGFTSRRGDRSSQPIPQCLSGRSTSWPRRSTGRTSATTWTPMIERTRTGVKRVASIVEKMRGLARTSPPQWESVSLAELVENTLEMMRGRLKHQRVEVAVNIHDVTRIECVPDQIGQVLLNLLINALQAIESTGPPGGGPDRGRGTTARSLGRDLGARQRPGDRAGTSGASVRPVLHDQARGRRHGAGTGDQSRNHLRPRRPDRGREPAGRGDLLPDPPAPTPQSIRLPRIPDSPTSRMTEREAC